MKTAIAIASTLGTQAFKNGVTCAPCMDKEYMDLVKQHCAEVGSSLPLAKAWIRSWTAANLAA